MATGLDFMTSYLKEGKNYSISFLLVIGMGASLYPGDEERIQTLGNEK